LAMERRLSAILAADVVGYSRLMEADEAGTFDRLRALRKELFEPEIAKRHGRIFKLMGDGLLAEFGSIVEAVECAVILQRTMAEHNKGVAHDQRIDVRMGINLGDVIVEGEDRHGDGVNIAARLEGLAEAGGIILSGTAYDQLKKKLDVGFEFLGERQVKNIIEPVRIYRLLLDPAAVGKTIGPAQKLVQSRGLGAKPSVAVLPFDNMSRDPEQQYFSDGITEDIITELSRFHSLFVIARNSSFQYRGKGLDVQQIGRELGVRYVLEGSVRRFGSRIRITAQLIDAETGAHLWADRYDRNLDDVFAIQDEVTKSIVTALPGRVDAAMADHIRRKPTEDLTAYDLLLRGEAYIRQGGFSDREALTMFTKALEIDPHCARAHARIAYDYAYNVFRWGTPSEQVVRLALEHAKSALTLDDSDSTAHATAAWTYLVSGDFDLADIHSNRAIELNPNDWYAARTRGVVTNYLGYHSHALEWIHKALRLDPLHPTTKLEALIDAYYMLHDYEKAIEAFNQWQDAPAHMWAEGAACYAQLGRIDEASTAVQQYEQRRPEGYEVLKVVAAHLRLCKLQADRDHWLEGYRKAGLPV
jgi:adenylate cyclase